MATTKDIEKVKKAAELMEQCEGYQNEFNSLMEKINQMRNRFAAEILLSDFLESVKKAEIENRKDCERRVKESPDSKRNAKGKYIYKDEIFEIELIPTTNVKLDQEWFDENYDDMTDDEKEVVKEETKWRISEAKYRDLKKAHPDEDLDIYKGVTETDGAPKLDITCKL